jgi:hypothetical protein
MRRIATGWASAALLVPALAACGSGHHADLTLTIRDGGVSLSKASTTEGAVSFDVDHLGHDERQLVLVHEPAGGAAALPLRPDGGIDLGAAEVVDRAGPFKPGRYRTGTPNLNPGRYLVVCEPTGAAATSTRPAAMRAELVVVQDPERAGAAAAAR